MKIFDRFIKTTFLTSFFGLAWAGDQIGTLTQVQGNVQIFSHPSKVLQKNSIGTHVLFENEYFLAIDAKVGDQLDKGNIIRASPGSKARVVYSNGDQINIGSATAYRITWNTDAPTAKTQIDLEYGKLRGIIEKGGPRSKLQIRTKTAVMGVRGTDFFIAQGGDDQATEVSIIRGAVEVEPKVLETKKVDSKISKSPINTEKAAPKPKPIQVTAGFSAEIGSITVATQAVEPKVELRKTTKEEFAGIQKSSTIIQNKPNPNLRTPSSEEDKHTAEVDQHIIELEKKAKVTTLKDIKTYDAKLYSILEKQGTTLASLEKNDTAINLEAINQVAVQNLEKAAPSAPKIHKPYKSELDSLENGAYDKYFKPFE